jgi:iron complex transport system substrate-binding protein
MNCCAWLICGLLLSVQCSFAASLKVYDDAERALLLTRHPTRILSLSPGATEILFAIGAGRHIVATVEFADEPAAARRIPRIGNNSSLDIERIVAFKPDIAVVWPGGAHPGQLAKLTQLGLPLYYQQVDAIADLPNSLRRLGRLTNTQAIADAAAGRLDKQLRALMSQYRDAKPITAMLQVWHHPVYAIGGKHMLHEVLQLCGAQNVFADVADKAPAVDMEAVVARNPAIIVAVAPPGVAKHWMAEWQKWPMLSAVKRQRLLPFEDQRLSRLGPGTLAAAALLCQKIDVLR